jgi:hypothetical protein
MRWKGVVLGTVVALLIGRLLPLVTPDFYAMIAYEESARGTTVMTTESQTTALGVWLLVLVGSWCLAYLIGGIVAGLIADSAAGLNGIMTVILGVVVGAVWVSWGVLGLVVGGSFEGPSGAENLGLFYVWSVVFLVSLPVILLSGFFGGRLGGAARRRANAAARS